MMLFHGSNQEFDCVDLSKSKDKRDFGKGFYITTIKEQTLQWGYNIFNSFGGNGVFLYMNLKIYLPAAPCTQWVV